MADGMENLPERRAQARGSWKSTADLPDKAALVQLNTLLAAKDDQIKTIQAEVDTCRQANSKQVSDLQNAYHGKVALLRQECIDRNAELEERHTEDQQAVAAAQGAFRQQEEEVARLRSSIAKLQSTVQQGVLERAALQQEVARLQSLAPQNMLGTAPPGAQLQKQTSRGADAVFWGLARGKVGKGNG